MKKLTLSLCAAIAMTTAAFAGETYSKESKSVTPPPCPQWYADNEFNLTLSGAYVWTGNDWRDDRYFSVDHAWGGAIDAKYFFRANRRQIINLAWIDKIEPWFSGGLLVHLKGGAKIELSRRQAQDFREKMSL